MTLLRRVPRASRRSQGGGPRERCASIFAEQAVWFCTKATGDDSAHPPREWALSVFRTVLGGYDLAWTSSIRTPSGPLMKAIREAALKSQGSTSMKTPRFRSSATVASTSETRTPK